MGLGRVPAASVVGAAAAAAPGALLPPDPGSARSHSVMLQTGTVAHAGSKPQATERSGTTASSGSTADGANPFAFPADEDIFKLLEDERAARAAEKAAAAGRSVHEKTTFSCRMQQTFGTEAIKRAFKDTLGLTAARPAGRPLDAATAAAAGGGGTGLLGTGAMAAAVAGEEAAAGGGAAAAAATLAAAACPARRRPPRENLRDFLARKREIFLVQMSLDAKRAEIRKLEERARQRAEALAKSEAMLEEDAVRFDAFLKENDEKVQEAIRRAEAEAKAKADRVSEIKRLNGVIGALRSELGKKEEVLGDCARYQEFLDAATHPDYFKRREAAKLARREARVAAWQAECRAVAERREAAAAAKTRADASYAAARTQQDAERAERAVREAAAELKEALAAREPPRPDLAALEAADEATDDSMHFADPRQLLEVFSRLEESNLFLIQNCQEAEEALEDVRARHRAARARLDAEAGALGAQIAALEAKVGAARARAERLRERAAQGDAGRPWLALGPAAGGGGGPAEEEGPSLEVLGSKVAEVYARCGFDPDPSLTVLQMLTAMEVRLQDCLEQAQSLPPDFVADAERAREKERRQVAREEKLSAQQADHEARVRRALARAAAPVYKRTGKPEMARSAPPARKVVTERRAGDEAEQELAAFLARELL